MNSLTAKEQKELKELENPNLKYLAPSAGSLPWIFKNSLIPKKERIIELRTKKRLAELKIDIKKEPQKYYKILREEEKKFDE